MDPNKLAEIFSNTREMERLVMAIHRIESAVVSISEKMGVVGSKVPEALKNAQEGIEGLDGALKNAKEKLDSLTDSSEAAFSAWEKFGQRARGVLQMLGYESMSVTQQLDKMSHTVAGLQADPKSMLMRAIHSMPFGGFVEAALRSQFRQDEFATAGRQAMMQFQGTGALSANQIRSLGANVGKQMMDLEEAHLGRKEDIAAVFSSMVEGGLKAEDTVKKVSFTVAGFGDTIANASLGLDKAFQLSAGTSMTFANQLRRDTNVGLTQSVDLVKTLGMASQATGMNMQAFTNTILQTTSALRVQGGDARDLAVAYLNIQKSFATATGMNEKSTRIAAWTAQAVQGSSSFVAGLGEDMHGHIGRQVATQILGKKRAEQMTHPQILNAMATGFQFEKGTKGIDESHFQRIVIEQVWKGLGNLSADEKALFLRKKGADPIFAQALLEADKRKNGMFDDKALTAAEVAHREKLEQAKDNEPLKEGTFDKMTKDLMNVMNAVGELLATLLSSIVRVLAGGFETLYRVFAGDWDVSQAAKRFGALLSDVGADFGKAGKRLGERAKAFGEGVTLPGLSVLKFGEVTEGEFSFLPDVSQTEKELQVRQMVDNSFIEQALAKKWNRGTEYITRKRKEMHERTEYWRKSKSVKTPVEALNRALSEGDNNYTPISSEEYKVQLHEAAKKLKFTIVIEGDDSKEVPLQ